MDSRDLMNPRSDQGPSTRDGGLRLKLMNQYAPSNREHQSRDGWSSGILLRLTAPARTWRGGAMAGPRESSNLRYRIPNAMWFLPMRSRTREEPNIHTYGGQPLVMASNSPEASPVTGTLPMVAVDLGKAFPGDKSAREAEQ
jgi:hypothetical protein